MRVINKIMIDVLLFNTHILNLTYFIDIELS